MLLPYSIAYASRWSARKKILLTENNTKWFIELNSIRKNPFLIDYFTYIFFFIIAKALAQFHFNATTKNYQKLLPKVFFMYLYLDTWNIARTHNYRNYIPTNAARWIIAKFCIFIKNRQRTNKEKLWQWLNGVPRPHINKGGATTTMYNTIHIIHNQSYEQQN